MLLHTLSTINRLLQVYLAEVYLSIHANGDMPFRATEATGILCFGLYIFRVNGKKPTEYKFERQTDHFILFIIRSSCYPEGNN